MRTHPYRCMHGTRMHHQNCDCDSVPFYVGRVSKRAGDSLNARRVFERLVRAEILFDKSIYIYRPVPSSHAYAYARLHLVSRTWTSRPCHLSEIPDRQAILVTVSYDDSTQQLSARATVRD